MWIRERVRKERSKGGTILDEVVLRQTLKACRACKALCEKESDCRSESFPLLCLPLVDVLQEGRERVLLERLLEILVSDIFQVNPRDSDEIERTGSHLLISLLRTSTNFFMSSGSAGSLIWKSENGDVGPSASRYEPPGWRRPPTKRMSKRASEYLRNSKVEPAWMSLFVTAS